MPFVEDNCTINEAVLEEYQQSRASGYYDFFPMPHTSEPTDNDVHSHINNGMDRKTLIAVIFISASSAVLISYVGYKLFMRGCKANENDIGVIPKTMYKIYSMLSVILYRSTYTKDGKPSRDSNF